MASLPRLPQAFLYGLVLTIVTTSFTSAIAAYKPRPGRPPKNVTHTATRSICDTNDLALKPLEPQNHIAEFGQVMDKPISMSLSWSIVNLPANCPLEVDLFDAEKQSWIASFPVQQTTHHIWVAHISQSLNPGKYAWQLTARNERITKQHPFEVSELPTAVSQAIGKARTPEQRSRIYAEAGFWYNALNEALRSQQPKTLIDLLTDRKNLEK